MQFFNTCSTSRRQSFSSDAATGPAADEAARIPALILEMQLALHVTDAAQQMGWSFFGPLIEQVIAVADGFSDDELAAIRTFLDRVTTAVADARSR